MVFGVPEGGIEEVDAGGEVVFLVIGHFRTEQAGGPSAAGASGKWNQAVRARVIFALAEPQKERCHPLLTFPDQLPKLVVGSPDSRVPDRRTNYRE